MSAHQSANEAADGQSELTAGLGLTQCACISTTSSGKK